MALFSAAVQINPQDAESHYNLGLAFFHANNMDKAVRQFSEALRLRPDSAQTRHNLQIALTRRSVPSPAAPPE